MQRWFVAGCMVVSWWVTPALAQDEPDDDFPDDPPATFSLDAVLVATFDHPKEVSRLEVARLEDLLRADLSNDHLVIPMADVPPFETYSAEIYMLGCPAGRYDGCALVIGLRAGVDWVVGGELHRDDVGRLTGVVSFVDAKRNDLLFQANVLFDGVTDEIVASRLADVLRAVVRGEFAPTDIRGDVEAAATQAAEQAAFVRRKIATDGIELADFDKDLGEVQRSDNDTAIQKVTKDDLDKYEGRDDTTPWERLKMSKFQYQRMKNTRSNTKDFRAKMRGRQGEILIGTGFGLGKGPWTQAWEGWYGLDDLDLTAVERVVRLEQQTDSRANGLWSAEVGVGVLPWLDVVAIGGTRIGDWNWRVQQVVENDDEPVDEPARKVVSTWFVGGRVDFAPMPTFPARPTLGVGAYWWQGTEQDKVVQVPDVIPDTMQRNWMAILQVQPGFEVNLGQHVLIWGRVTVDVPVAGRTFQQDGQPGAILAAFPAADQGGDGVGVGGAIGATARIRIGGNKKR